MTKDQSASLQERIVNEITSTYNSIAAYKNHTSKSVSYTSELDISTAERRIQLVEHKLKALKMMLAKIDDGEFSYCEKCHKPIAPKSTLLKHSKAHFCSTCA